MLLNIDKPHCTATVHREDCAHIPTPDGTEHKPAGEMGRDGGWFTVTDERQGQAVAVDQFERGVFQRCPYC
jgi:hypothetical protein